MNEMKLFDEWYLQKHLNMNLSDRQLDELYQCYEEIYNIVSKIPKSFMHRDFHSRNLMVTSEKNPGVLDYQDAIIGPITYDLASLLRDCYIAWDDEIVYSMTSSFFHIHICCGCRIAANNYCNKFRRATIFFKIFNSSEKIFIACFSNMLTI